MTDTQITNAYAAAIQHTNTRQELNQLAVDLGFEFRCGHITKAQRDDLFGIIRNKKANFTD